MENYKKNYTFLAYGMFFYIGIFFMLPGALKLEIAHSYQKGTSDIQFLLTFFTSGSFFALIVNKVLLEKLDSKKILLICYSLSVFGILLIGFAKTPFIFSISLTLFGLSAGMIMSISNYIIINLYKEERTKKLNMLNFCYSFGSLASPIFIVILAGINFTWQEIYRVMLVFLIIGIIYTVMLPKFEVKKQEFIEKTKEKSMGLSGEIIVVGMMMFLYVCSEISMTYWLEEFSLNKDLTAKMAKLSISVFWISIALGRVVVGTFKIKIKNSILLVSFSMTALIFSLLAYFSSKVLFVVFLALAGIGYSILYATILSYGTTLKENISTGVMTFYIVCGSIGSIAASPISGAIKKMSNVKVVYISAVLMMATVLMISLAVNVYIKKKQKYIQSN